MFYPEIEVSVVGRGDAREAGGEVQKRFRAEILGGRGVLRAFPHGKISNFGDDATWMQHFDAHS
jgi:DNA helicase TIP49 (TBP-interacting protein)